MIWLIIFSDDIDLESFGKKKKKKKTFDMDDLEEALPDEDGVRIKFYVLSKAKLILLVNNTIILYILNVRTA